MKNSIVLTLTIVVLGGCAKIRTSEQFSTQGQTRGPITTVLTNSDYDQQQTDLKNQAKIKPLSPSEFAEKNPETSILMKEEFEQAHLAKLFESYAVDEIEIGPREDVICEFVPQVRKVKTLGRLSCMKQHPDVKEETAIKDGTRFECVVDTSNTKSLQLSDKTLYENLEVEETENSPGRVGYRVFKKTIGRFHCEKTIKIPSGAVRYECSAYMVYD